MAENYLPNVTIEWRPIQGGFLGIPVGTVGAREFRGQYTHLEAR